MTCDDSTCVYCGHFVDDHDDHGCLLCGCVIRLSAYDPSDP